MTILCQILYDRHGEPLYVLFRQGEFSTPLAILTKVEAEVIALSVQSEKRKNKEVGHDN